VPQTLVPSGHGWQSSIVPMSLQPFGHGVGVVPHLPSAPQTMTPSAMAVHWRVPGVHVVQASIMHVMLGQFVVGPQCPLLSQVLIWPVPTHCGVFG
jgi:hypothetical protein